MNRNPAETPSPLRSKARSAAALCLALLLPGQMLPAQAHPSTSIQPLASPAEKPQPSTSKIKPLPPNAAAATSDQRILHLLNRFTFGATPGDIAAVRELGPQAIDLWFNQQLHPDQIPDAALTARLADYPALQLPVDQLIHRFPSNAEIREASKGKRPIPKNPQLAAIYRRHIDEYREKEAKKAEEKAKTTAGPEVAMVPAAAAKTEAAPMPGPAPAATKQAAANSEPARDTYTESRVASVLALPPAQRVNRILAMPSEEYEQFHSNLKGPAKAQLTADLDPNQRELLADYENPTRAVVEELQDQRLLRDIYSSRQLQEVMTTFWLNHFNVYLHKNDEAPYYIVSYERDVIRPRALGYFENLLVATAQSPAMLLYLDNSSSTGPRSEVAEKHVAPMFGKDTKPAPGLNENYARELMELHTLGVNGGYTQKDVTEVARIFTGWTVDHPQQGGTSAFDPSRHEPGKKTVMGRTIKPNGQKEGLQLLHMLATSPATAHFISQEMAVAFVSDNPPAALVNRMAQAFQHSNGYIPYVLRTMLHSPEFWAPEDYEAKVKTPLEYVVSAARASGADVADPRPLVNALNQMGMPLYACVPPTGYSAKADTWVSTGALVTRMNFALTLATNHYNGIKPDWDSSIPQVTTATEAEQLLEARLIPGGVSEKTRSAVLNQAQPAVQVKSQAAAPPSTQLSAQKVETQPAAKPKPANPNAQVSAREKQDAQIAGLLLGSPEFQRR